ncbi:hypothetical protein IWQ62_004483 [Dispira parvispora]|uniref:LIM zinc-binding domain-containing protein n=1 Tax=Dispira parvispora TaxID=1520584 RepID=A0A9W8AST8_9FUNG|nr:hypothetical protein IWQ62_004483 [Dispira parvispora]
MAFCSSCGDIVRGSKCRCGGRIVTAATSGSEGTTRHDPWSSTYLSRRFGDDDSQARARPISLPPTKANSPVSSRPTSSTSSTKGFNPPSGVTSPEIPRNRTRAYTTSPQDKLTKARAKARSSKLLAPKPKPSEVHHYLPNAYCPPPIVHHFPPPSSPQSPTNRLQSASPRSRSTATSVTSESPLPSTEVSVSKPAVSTEPQDSFQLNGISRVQPKGSALEGRRECVECHKPLKDNERQTSPLKPGANYCDDCYSHGFSKGFCHACKRLILTHGRPWVQYNDRSWHKMCLNCVVCGKFLLEPVVDLAGNPCCEGCFTVSSSNRPAPRPLSDKPAGNTNTTSASTFADPSVVPPYQKRLSCSPRSPLATVIQAHPFPKSAEADNDSSLRRSSVDKSSLCLPSKLPPSHRLSINETSLNRPESLHRTASQQTLDETEPTVDEAAHSTREKAMRPDSGFSDVRDSVSSTPSAEATLTPPTPLGNEMSMTSDGPINGLAESFSSQLRLGGQDVESHPTTPVDNTNTSRMLPKSPLVMEPKEYSRNQSAKLTQDRELHVPTPTTTKASNNLSVHGNGPVLNRSQMTYSRASTTTPVSAAVHPHGEETKWEASSRPPTVAKFDRKTPVDSPKAQAPFTGRNHSHSDPRSALSMVTPALTDAVPQRCAKCRTLIQDTWFRLTDGRQLHPECFTCCGCHQLIDDGMYVVDRGLEYHQKCVPMKPPVVSAQVATPDPSVDHCDRCRGVLDGPRFQLTNGKRYHPDCFICSGCQKLFEEGTYVCYEGQEYHRECVPKMNVLRCGKCRCLINGVFVRHNSQSYHPHCFTCTSCHQEITPQMPFGELQGAPYCEVCLNHKVGAHSTFSSPAMRPYPVSAAMSYRQRDRATSQTSKASPRHISKVVY